MNTTTIEVSFDDLAYLHAAWEKVRAINDLYPHLLMTGEQADRLTPISMNQFRDLTDLRDRMGQAILEANPTEPTGGYPDAWEITEQFQVALRKSKEPSN